MLATPLIKHSKKGPLPGHGHIKRRSSWKGCTSTLLVTLTGFSFILSALSAFQCSKGHKSCWCTFSLKPINHETVHLALSNPPTSISSTTTTLSRPLQMFSTSWSFCFQASPYRFLLPAPRVEFSNMKMPPSPLHCHHYSLHSLPTTSTGSLAPSTIVLRQLPYWVRSYCRSRPGCTHSLSLSHSWPKIPLTPSTQL